MSYELEIKAFFFNAKTDYLPYYKTFSISLSENATAKELLEAIKLQNENFSYPMLNLTFRVNDLVVEGDIPVSMIVEKLGKSLKIDPVTSYRSKNGLIINDNDFMQSFELLAPYATSSDKEYYKSLYALHYASETSNFERQYIGDAILILAHKMISEGSSHKDEILDAITSVDSGLFDCEYENNLFIAQDHSESIESLKQMAKNDENTHPSLLEIIGKYFKNENIPQKHKKPKKPKITPANIQNLEEKYIAYNQGKHANAEILEYLSGDDSMYIHFDREKKLSGVNILQDNETLAFKKAGATILSAFDSGAEVLIIEDIETYTMMKINFAMIEKIAGREIIGLELISSKEFITQMNMQTT